MFCVGALLVMAAFVGGERTECEAANTDGWVCVRTKQALLWHCLGLEEMDRLRSTDVATIANRPSYWRRAGYAVEVRRSDGTRFQLGRRSSTEEAMTDRAAFLRFTKHPGPGLILEAPAHWWKRLVAYGLAGLVASLIAVNVPRWWRGT